MKIGELLKGKNFAEILQASKEQDKEGNQRRQNFLSGTGFIKKLKLEADTSYMTAVPLEMALPFNPADLSADDYSRSNPYVVPGSVTSAVILMKNLAKENEELLAKLCDVMGCKEADLNLDVGAIDGLEERKLWHKMCRLQFITGYVQHINTDPSKFKFGRNIGCTAIVDEDGNIEGSVGIGYRLFELEQALISITIQQIQEQYTEEKRLETEIESATKAVWKDRLISNPYSLSFMRVIAMQVRDANNGIVEKRDGDLWTKNHDLRDFQRYMKVLNTQVDTIEAVLSSKNDIHDDFIEMLLIVPKDTGKGNIYQDINRFAANPSSTIILEPSNGLEDFTEKYRDFRDDDKIWTDKLLKKSIYDFRQKSDSALLAEIKNNLAGYQKAMNSTELLTSYEDVLSQIDESLTSNIADTLLTEGDNGKAIDETIISAAPKMDETTDFMSQVMNELDDEDDDE